jgi:membrane dipeptidase
VIPVVDGHNDALLRVWRDGGSLLERNDAAQIDVPHMREGGIAAGFFAVYVPETDGPMDWWSAFVRSDDGYERPLDAPVEPARAARIAAELAAIFDRDLAPVLTVAGLERCIAGDGVGAILHLEGAEPIEPDLSNLEDWYERGMRSLGIVWSRPNAFGQGVPFRYPGTPDTGPGLTEAGRALVRACNELGVMVDLSHLNESGFLDVAQLSTAPLVATHTAAHALAPIPRNLLDRQLDAVRDSGGIVGAVFDRTMTHPRAEIGADTHLDVLLDQIEHLTERMGIEHVALGSDYDGCMPIAAVGDAGKVQTLLQALAARGWGEDDLRALAHGNWVRVLGATWR